MKIFLNPGAVNKGLIKYTTGEQKKKFTSSTDNMTQTEPNSLITCVPTLMSEMIEMKLHDSFNYSMMYNFFFQRRLII